MKMKRYDDFKTDKTKEDLSDDDFKKVKWTQYKIIVPTKEDKDELMKAFKYFHGFKFDSDIIVVNQLAHEYCDEDTNNIIINEQLFNSLK